MAVVWSIKFHLVSSQVHRIAIGSTAWIVASSVGGIDLHSVTVGERETGE